MGSRKVRTTMVPSVDETISAMAVPEMTLERSLGSS